MKIPAEWLVQRAENAPTSYHSARSPMAALRARSAWQKLKGRAEAGDQLWWFSSPTRTPAERARHAGYALVRDGMVMQSAIVEPE